MTTVADLLASHTWVAIHGGGGSGKTQLVARAVDVAANCDIWLRLRGLDDRRASEILRSAVERRAGGTSTSFGAVCDAACAAIGRGKLVILDDLPRLSANGALPDDIATLVQSCQREGVGVVSTSLYAVPVSVETKLGRAVAALQAPRFTVEEAAELLRGQGAPEQIVTAKRAEFLNAIAKGHPLLLAGVAHYLKSRGWRFTTDEVEGLFRGEFKTAVADEVLPRLMNMLEPSARELLYRLNLVGGGFSDEDASTLAAIPPVVPRPREVLQSLLGFCLQRDGSARYVVAPPVEALGSADLEADTQRNCHGILGGLILASGPLDEWTAARAIAHLVGAGELNRAGSVLLSGLHSVLRLARKKRRDIGQFLLSLWGSAELPTKMDLGLRLYIRALQISVYHMTDRPTAYLLRDFGHLLSQAPAAERVSIYAAAANVAPVLANTDPSSAFQLLSRAVEAIPEIYTASRERGAALPASFSPEYILWTAVPWVRDLGQLRMWVRLIEKLDQDGINQLRAADQSGEFSMSVATGVWLAESQRPPAEQRWEAVEREFQEAAATAKRFGLELLWANLIRSMMTVRGEYRRDLAGAVGIGEAALNEASSDPGIQFVIRESLGRQYHFKDQHADALGWLRSALDQSTAIYPITRMYGLIYTSISAGQTDAAEALRCAELAANLLNGLPKQEWSSESAQIESVKILGELALAQWMAGDLRASYATLNRAAAGLLGIRSRNDDWKEVFVLLGYVFGYLAPLARSGSPPDLNQFGKAFRAPYRGLFFSHHAGRASLYAPVKESLLHVHLADLGASVGEYSTAVLWARAGLEAARDSGPSVIVDLIAWHVVAQELIDGHFDEACRIGLDAVRNAAAFQALRSAGQDDIDACYDPDTVLVNADPRFLAMAHQIATEALVISMATQLATVAVKEPTVLDASVDSATSAVRQLSNGPVSAETWRSFGGVLEAFRQGASAKELIAIGNRNESDEYRPARAAAYVCATVQQRGEPNEAVRAHFAVFPLIQRLSAAYAGLYRISLDFLLAYWQQQVEQCPFRFGAPKLIRESLASAAGVPPRTRAQTILSAVANSLGTAVHPEAKKWLGRSNSEATK